MVAYSCHEVEQIKNSFEAQIQPLLAEAELHPTLHAAAVYSLSGGGKRVRPLLMIAIAQVLLTNRVKEDDSLYRAAFALELLHTASLIHDDMPELDNDSYRRGRETCHIKYGGGGALLLGDALIPAGCFIVSNSKCENRTKANILRYLNKAYLDLCNGQAFDAKIERGVGDGAVELVPQPLKLVFRLKTGALFRAAGEIAAAVSGLPDLAHREIGQCCEELGVLFQVLNDYYDMYGSAEERGRPESSDAHDLERNIFGALSKEQLLHDCAGGIKNAVDDLRNTLTRYGAVLAGEGSALHHLLQLLLERAEALKNAQGNYS